MGGDLFLFLGSLRLGSSLFFSPDWEGRGSSRLVLLSAVMGSVGISTSGSEN